MEGSGPSTAAVDRPSAALFRPNFYDISLVAPTLPWPSTTAGRMLMTAD